MAKQKNELPADDILKIDYRPEGDLRILEVVSLEIDVTPEDYGITDFAWGMIHALKGQFFYCGMGLDGEVLFLEDDFNALFRQLPLKMTHVWEREIVFKQLTENQIKKVFQTITVPVRSIGDCASDDDEEERWIFEHVNIPASKNEFRITRAV